MATWNENKPSPSDVPNLELASLITSNKGVLRQSLEKHSFWTDSSTNSIGVPRLSEGSAGPGSARAYYDVRSNLSTPAAASRPKPLSGRLYIASDTSEFFGYAAWAGGPFGTSPIPLGGLNAIVYTTGSQATIPQGNITRVQHSTVSIVATSSGTSILAVSFASQYNVAPQVQVTPFSISIHTNNLALPALTSITTSGFSVALRSISGGAYATNLMWRSHGTVAL